MSDLHAWAIIGLLALIHATQMARIYAETEIKGAKAIAGTWLLVGFGCLAYAIGAGIWRAING